jgi:hypothetical protein
MTSRGFLQKKSPKESSKKRFPPTSRNKLGKNGGIPTIAKKIIPTKIYQRYQPRGGGGMIPIPATWFGYSVAPKYKFVLGSK